MYNRYEYFEPLYRITKRNDMKYVIKKLFFFNEINTIAPGLFGTPMLSGMSEEVQQSLIATTLFPKRLGTAKEYGSLVESIITNAMLNGETIRLDGSVRLAPR